MKSEDYNKVVSAINSCITTEQLDSARHMVDNYLALHGNGDRTDLADRLRLRGYKIRALMRWGGLNDSELIDAYYKESEPLERMDIADLISDENLRSRLLHEARVTRIYREEFSEP